MGVITAMDNVKDVASSIIRIGIISHIDQTDRKIPLPEDKRKADMLKKIFR